jgi:hypothetical protein
VEHVDVAGDAAAVGVGVSVPQLSQHRPLLPASACAAASVAAAGGLHHRQHLDRLPCGVVSLGVFCLIMAAPLLRVLQATCPCSAACHVQPNLFNNPARPQLRKCPDRLQGSLPWSTYLGAGAPAAERGLQRRRQQPGRRGLLLHRRLAQRYQLRRPLVQLILQPPAGTQALCVMYCQPNSHVQLRHTCAPQTASEHSKLVATLLLQTRLALTALPRRHVRVSAARFMVHGSGLFPERRAKP